MNKTAFLSMALVAICAVTVWSEPTDPVNFNDGILKQAVIKTLKSLGIVTIAPTEEDMLALTQFYAEGLSITDITGLEYAKNLWLVQLHDNQISDIGPLASLTNLTRVNMNNNLISDIGPLADLKELVGLVLQGNNIADIDALQNHTKLEWLFLYNNQISNVSPLSECKVLETLSLENNLISDISPLSELTSLKSLGLRYNQIDTLGSSPLPETLTYLGLEWNPISDISMLSGLVNLEHLNLIGTRVTDLTPLTNLWQTLQILCVGRDDQTPTLFSDVSPVASLTNLRELTVGYNVSDISPLSELMQLTYLDVRYNPLNDDAYCFYLPRIESNNPGIELLYDIPDPWPVCNTPPIAMIIEPPSGAIAAVDSVIELAGAIDDPDEGDTHDYIWTIGTDMWLDDLPIEGTSTDRTISELIALNEAGIYQILLAVTDESGDRHATSTVDGMPAFVVIYDPDGGFVTGGGWIDSPAGAYGADLELAGKASFGFVSKYKRGAATPTGNTEFRFKAGDLDFHSTSYDWLVVTGSNFAKFKGTGSINGSGEYKFQIWAGDGESSGDTFRIKIWEEDSDEYVVYDNGMDQVIGGGSIVVHAN